MNTQMGYEIHAKLDQDSLKGSVCHKIRLRDEAVVETPWLFL